MIRCKLHYTGMSKLPFTCLSQISEDVNILRLRISGFELPCTDAYSKCYYSAYKGYNTPLHSHQASS